MISMEDRAARAIAQDDQTGRWNPFGQGLITQHKGGKLLQPRVQRVENGFAMGGHSSTFNKVGSSILIEVLRCRFYFDGFEKIKPAILPSDPKLGAM